MNWLQKASAYYKGRTQCRIIENLGGGKALVEFENGDRVSVYYSQLTSEPVLSPMKESECPECRLLSGPRGRLCEHCKAEF